MHLHLDPSIRNWVFFPITFITVMVNLLIKYLTSYLNNVHSSEQILQSQSKENDFKSEMQNKDIDIKITHGINRSNKLRQNYMYISDKGFKLRKAFYCKEEVGFCAQKIDTRPPDMMNMGLMGDMIKKQVVNMLYYAITIVGCGYFFSGFILLKLPFGITQKFRSMLQQGLNIPNLDLNFVSAVSWCFMLVFGLNSIIAHFDGKDDFSMLKEQEKMMMAPTAAMGGPKEKNFMKILSSEKESIEIVPNFSLLDSAIEEMNDKYDYLIN